eukprot:COSAG06_NODE_24092_length_673_cov_0.834495_1_plen_38_part_01
MLGYDCSVPNGFAGSANHHMIDQVFCATKAFLRFSIEN